MRYERLKSGYFAANFKSAFDKGLSNLEMTLRYNFIQKCLYLVFFKQTDVLEGHDLQNINVLQLLFTAKVKAEKSLKKWTLVLMYFDL